MDTRVATMYEHTQAVASATWTINHYLRDYPIIDVYVSDGGELQKVIPNAVTYVDENTCTVNFTAPYTGFATVV